MREELRDMFPIDRRAVEQFLRGDLKMHLQTMTTRDAYKYAEALRRESYRYREDMKYKGIEVPINKDVRMFIYETPGEEQYPLFFSTFRFLLSLGHDIEEIHRVLHEQISDHDSDEEGIVETAARDQIEASYGMAYKKLVKIN